MGFDPTNNLVAGDRHIRTAIGRDYSDVPPDARHLPRPHQERTERCGARGAQRRHSATRSRNARARRLVDPRREGAGAARTASAADAATAAGAAAVTYCEGVTVAALTAYFDDSGTHTSSPVALVAAWVSPAPQWKKLVREWNKAKDEFGFQTLHMAELMANNPKSEFADKDYWNEGRKAKLLKRLREIIGKHAGQGFENSVTRKDYDSRRTTARALPAVCGACRG
jgi:hypothetical protein